MAVPGAMAVAFPALSTIATLELLLFQMTDLSAALLGNTIAVIARVSPSVRVTDDALRVMLVTAMLMASNLPKLLHGAISLYDFSAETGTCRVAYSMFDSLKVLATAIGTFSA